MFGTKFSNKFNNLFKFEKRNFSVFRSLKTAVTRNKSDEQALEVINLLKRKVKNLIIILK